MTGVVTPAVAINVFAVKQITKVPFEVIYKGVYPFLVSFVAVGRFVVLVSRDCSIPPQSAHEITKKRSCPSKTKKALTCMWL
jgi:TRAP-type C4-dicarboxylate transport system permease large subunit